MNDIENLKNELSAEFFGSKKLSTEQLTRAIERLTVMREAEAELRSMGMLDEKRAKFVQEIVDLEKKASTSEGLTNIEQVYLQNLRDVIVNGEQEPTIISTQQKLLEKVGAEKYKIIKRSMAEHVKELEALKAINDELQRQTELIGGVRTTVNYSNESGVGITPSFGASKFSTSETPRPEGTYIVEVNNLGLVTEAYRVDPKKPTAIMDKLPRQPRPAQARPIGIDPLPTPTVDQANDMQLAQAEVALEALNARFEGEQLRDINSEWRESDLKRMLGVDSEPSAKLGFWTRFFNWFKGT